MRWFAYSFEAKGIQAYIGQGGRLRDMTAASAVVDALCADTSVRGAGRSRVPVGGLLDDALKAAAVPHDGKAFLRRAAGAFSLVLSGEEAGAAFGRFHRLWALIVAHAAPGLETVAALAEGASARAASAAANAALRANRSRRAPALPKAPPLALRAPRTGEPAVATRPVRGEPDVVEPLDMALARKQSFSGAITPARLCAPNASLEEWPLDFDADFPFRGENRSIAVIHADGNRMGALVRALGESLAKATDDDFRQTMRTFSTAIEGATIAAVQAATTEHLQPETVDLGDGKNGSKRPGRPILIGGDDVCFIVRGDKALGFAETFLTEFQSEARKRLQNSLGKHGQGLTRHRRCAPAGRESLQPC